MTEENCEFVLVLNAGSSSLKFALFDLELNEKDSGAVTEIGEEDSKLKIGDKCIPGNFRTHELALGGILTYLANTGFSTKSLAVVGHRVVHGGQNLTKPVIVTDEILDSIHECCDLAPLHNPHNISGIRAMQAVEPELLQVACFDTAFHSTNPRIATAYALPLEYEKKGMRRFGFHGHSYEALVENLPTVSNKKLPDRILAFHLGNGASVCAIQIGRSVATSMGYSPLDGLTMGTRVGSIDGHLVLQLVREADGDIEEVEDLLYEKSGLFGLSQISANMEVLLRSQIDDANSRFAIDHFCYWSIRHGASMIAAMKGLDAIVFTGGIGENAPLIRKKIVDGFDWLNVAMVEQLNQSNSPKLHAEKSAADIWIVPADEERQIARRALECLASGPRGIFQRG